MIRIGLLILFTFSVCDLTGYRPAPSSLVENRVKQSAIDPLTLVGLVKSEYDIMCGGRNFQGSYFLTYLCSFHKKPTIASPAEQNGIISLNGHYFVTYNK